MKELLRKEFHLSLHPTAPLFLALSALLLTPNYPYLVTFFYTGLAVFFICLSGRENHDVFFTMTLPVSKRQIVRARMTMVILLQLTQWLLAASVIWLRQKLPIPKNAVGMEANLALLGLALGMMGLFNLTFFRVYYRSVQRVGTAFLWSSAVMFVYVFAEEICTHALPFFRDRLDTADPLFLAEKLAVLAAGGICYLALTAIAYRRAAHDFQKQDL